MKTIFPLLFFVLLNTVLSSQNYFVSEIGDEDTRTVFFEAVETNDNCYILSGFKGIHQDSLGAYIIKLDSTGMLCKENVRYKTDSTWVYTGIELNDDNTYTLVSTINSTTHIGESYFLITEIDENLNIVSENKIDFQFDTLTLYSNYCKITQNEIYVYGECAEQSYTYLYSYVGIINSDTSFFKIIDGVTSDFEIIDSVLYRTGSIYIDTAYLGTQVFFEKRSIKDLTLDTIYLFSYSVDNYFHLERRFFKKYSDSSFVYFYSNGDIQEPRNGLFLIDTNFNFLKDTVLNSFRCYSDIHRKGLDFLYHNDIYIINNAGTCNITKVDSNFNIIWQKFLTLGLDYWTIGVTATRDSGALVISVFDDTTLKTRVIKFDKNGNYAPSVVENHHLVSNFSVFPNPATDYIKVFKAVQVEKADFELYNSLGQIVLQETLTENITELQVADLPKGLYIYNILQNNEIVEEGKIIKE